MDIGIVQPELVYPRGAEKQVCKLSYHLNKMGHEVTIYTFEKEKNYIFDPLLENIEITSLNKKWVIDKIPLFNHVRWANLIKKLSLEIRNHDIINAHNHPAQWISKFSDIPVVWTCNEPYMYNTTNLMRKVYFFNYLFDRYYSSQITSVLSLDSQMKEIIRNMYPKLHVETIGSGVDLERIVKYNQNEYFDSIFIGPIHPQKRPLDIVKAFSLIKDKIPNIRMHFVGKNLSNSMKNDMIDLAKRNKLEILFYDSPSNEELYRLFDIADISVFVPEAQPWGIFPLETILGGIPTLISDQCGVKDVLPPDYPVIRTGDINELANKILEIKDNYGYYKQKTIKISKIIAGNYSWEAYSKRIEAHFNKILNK